LRRVAKSIQALASRRGRPSTKHLAVYETFRTEIESGHLAPGTRLPSDTALAAALPASLATIQKALRRLADDGLLVRHHRKGTFVYDAPVNESEIRNLRFLADGRNALLPARVRVRGIALVPNDGEWSERFANEIELIRIDRICNINYEFDVVLETYLPARRFRTLRTMSPRELDGTPLAYYLDKRLGAPTLRVERRFQLVSRTHAP
jgi:DNA-binding GntR family transcriptional regulator